MPNDTTLQSVFDYAKQGPLSGGEFPTLPAVFVTFVEHFPNSHPPGSSKGSADLVTYANGQMMLSQNKKTLSGEFMLWRNAFDPGSPGFFGSPPTPPDAFDDAASKLTVSISVSDSGKVTHQRKLNGNPIGGMPPTPMNATYDNSLLVEKTTSGVRSLSFTLGTTT
jgi:hypothetical protein